MDNNESSQKIQCKVSGKQTSFKESCIKKLNSKELDNVTLHSKILDDKELNRCTELDNKNINSTDSDITNFIDKDSINKEPDYNSVTRSKSVQTKVDSVPRFHLERKRKATRIDSESDVILENESKKPRLETSFNAQNYNESTKMVSMELDKDEEGVAHQKDFMTETKNTTTNEKSNIYIQQNFKSYSQKRQRDDSNSQESDIISEPKICKVTRGKNSSQERKVSKHQLSSEAQNYDKGGSLKNADTECLLVKSKKLTTQLGVNGLESSMQNADLQAEQNAEMKMKQKDQTQQFRPYE